MKKLIFALFFLGMLSSTYAQHIKISEAPRIKGNGTYNSFLFELPDVSKKDAEKEWKRYMKKFAPLTNYNAKQKLYTSKNARIPKLTSEKVNVYARVMDDKNPIKRTTMIVWFESKGGYINSDKNRAAGDYIKVMLTEFATSISQFQTRIFVSEDKQIVKTLEQEMKIMKKENEAYAKEITALQKSTEAYTKEIEKAKKRIAELEEKIKTNDIDLMNTADALKARQEVMKLNNNEN